MRGRKPKPTAIKRREGNPGGRKLPKKEPRPPAGDTEAATWLTGGALAEWRRIVPILMEMGIYSDADRAALEVYCQAYARWREAEEALAKTGLIMTTPNGHLQPAPHVSLARRYGDQVAKLAAEFGLTPSGRSRVNAEPLGEPDEGAGDDFFRKGRRPPRQGMEAQA